MTDPTTTYHPLGGSESSTICHPGTLTECGSHVCRAAVDARPETITVCGSMRYFSLMLRVATEETIAGRIVLMPFEAVPPGEQGGDLKAMLDRLHREKILQADRIIVVSDESGYYGDSTRGEIEYARSLGLPVDFRQVAAPDDDEIERAAEASWHVYWGSDSGPWAEEPADTQDEWRAAIRAALAALKEGQ